MLIFVSFGLPQTIGGAFIREGATIRDNKVFPVRTDQNFHRVNVVLLVLENPTFELFVLLLGGKLKMSYFDHKMSWKLLLLGLFVLLSLNTWV